MGMGRSRCKGELRKVKRRVEKKGVKVKIGEQRGLHKGGNRKHGNGIEDESRVMKGSEEEGVSP